MKVTTKVIKWMENGKIIGQVINQMILKSFMTFISQRTYLNGAFEDKNIDKNLPVVCPYWIPESPDPDKKDIKELKGHGIRATWLGHASVLAEIDGFNVLCDPIFSKHCGPPYLPAILAPKVCQF